jgi:hypothetical protein
LKQFADRHGRVQVYDRIARKMLPPQHVKDVAVVSNLYTIEDPDGNPSDAFEQGPLARFDGDIAKRLTKLLAPTLSLTIRDRAAINVFIALQFVRTKVVRDSLADALDRSLRFHVELNVAGASADRVKRFIEERYPDASAKDRVEIRRIAADPSYLKQLTTEEWINWIVENLPLLAELVMSRRWIFVRPESGAFLSCDNPVVLFGPQPIGLGNASLIFWPLSPNRMLWLSLPGSHDGSSFEGGSAPPDLVADLNQITADQATRQIFWHPETDPIASIILPTGPLMRSVNGVPVGLGENSYDKIRENRFRDCASSQHARRAAI